MCSQFLHKWERRIDIDTYIENPYCNINVDLSIFVSISFINVLFVKNMNALMTIIPTSLNLNISPLVLISQKY
jgi:hypothetical protein